MRISKTKFMECSICPKAGWLTQNRPDLYEETGSEKTLEKGKEIGDIAKRYFGPDFEEVETVDDKGAMIRQTEELLNNGCDTIMEASFTHDGCFCSTDIFKVRSLEKKTCTIWEVKSSTKVEASHIRDMAFQYYVVNGLGWKIEAFYLVHINPDYMREGELVINELFAVKDCTANVLMELEYVKEHVAEFKSLLGTCEEPDTEIGPQCHSPYDCPYFSYCTRHLPERNIFQVSGRGVTFKKKVDLYKQGIYSYEDILTKKPKAFNAARMDEIRHICMNTDGELHMDKIKEFLGTFRFPLYFLDFETFQNAIPEWDLSEPYEQTPFQYSLHILTKDGKLYHKKFIGKPGKDPRHTLGERLVGDILDDGGSIIAYNAAFEKMVIRNLGDMFFDLYPKTRKLLERFVDIMTPFSERWVYKPAFKHSYSIKFVLPALFPDDLELDYHKLDTIQNGSQAMTEYQALKNKPKEEQEHILKCLDDYCGLDTYAMVKIYWWLVDEAAVA